MAPSIKDLVRRDKKESELDTFAEIIRASEQSIIRVSGDFARELDKYRKWLVVNGIEGNKYK